MENIIVCTLLYAVCAFAALYRPTPKTEVAPKLKPEIQQSSVYDISCIFTDESKPEPRPAATQLQELTVKELRELAKEHNVAKASQLKKAQLITALRSSRYAA